MHIGNLTESLPQLWFLFLRNSSCVKLTKPNQDIL